MKAKAAKADALEGRIKAANDARIAKVPDAMRTLIRDYDVEKLSKWQDANLEKLTNRLRRISMPERAASAGDSSRSRIR